MDGLLKQTYNAPQDRDALLNLLLQVSRYARDLEHELEAYRQSRSPPTDRGATSPPSDANEEEESGVIVDKEKMPDYIRHITSQSSNHRYYGPNSSVLFVQGVMEMHGTAAAVAAVNSTRPLYWTRHPVSLDGLKGHCYPC